MSLDRVTATEHALDRYLDEARPARFQRLPEELLVEGGHLTVAEALALYEDQLLSRAIDAEARRLKALGQSYYTISSAGHEQNVVLGSLLRTTDPCFLHYRSGALMMARSRAGQVEDPVLDTMLSLCAAEDDPVARGRHKVWGSRALWVPPQTSTIASHLPKAVGAAFALSRARRMQIETSLPHDSVVLCSFGDASANHATALTGIGAARYGNRRGNPMPLLFVCEDNGIGISVDTPRRWIRDSFSTLSHLRYFEAEGSLDQVYEVAREAVETCRSQRMPVFLRLVCVRLWGHAGSDIETAYRTAGEIAASEAQDPLLVNARRLITTGAATPHVLKMLRARVRDRVAEASREAVGRRPLPSRTEVMATLAPYDEDRVRRSATGRAPAAARAAFWAGDPPESATLPVKRTMAAHISAALADEMLRRPEILVFGEDVARKGGVYYVTAGLQKRFGRSRVIDTHLDETSILGLAQGAAMMGLLPVPEIQYLAYVHNAVDQLRGEAASLSFFSDGQFTNPMVVRIASFAYQKGFGGHFHNDNSIGGLRDIPGLVLVAPARGDDAVRLLRGAVAMAHECGRVVCFLEPIALYHERDLFDEGDGLWLSDYPAPGEALLPGEIGSYGPEDAELLLVSYANGLRMSLQAQRLLEREHGLTTRVIDVRWLNPLPLDEILREVRGRRGVLVVDEARHTGGGIADAVLAYLAENDAGVRLRSVRSADSFVPLGPAADTVLLQTPAIIEAALTMTGR